MTIPRTIQPVLSRLAKAYPVVTVTGPRQAGKTTLCRSTFPDLPYVNLEAPDVREALASDPRSFLRRHPDGAILDEVQRVPELLSYIQGVVDEPRNRARFVVTGSQHFGLTEAVSQSLAGRTAVLSLLPFSIEEVRQLVPNASARDLLHTGFYPRIHDRGLDPSEALGSYLATYVERDVRQITEIRNLAEFQRFLRLCAGRTGQLLNLQGVGADAGVSQPTARAWINLLEASYIAFRLPPFFANISKRLTKAPKLYFCDVGLAAYLLGIESSHQLDTHPLRGALFENLVVVEALKHRFNQGRASNLFFYREHRGYEIDLVYSIADRLGAIEIKSGETLNADFLGSFRHARAALGDRIVSEILVYGGDWTGTYQGVRVTDAAELSAHLAQLDEG